MLMKKVVALRNEMAKPPELIVFEGMIKDSFVLGLNLRYIYDSATLEEATYHIWLINKVLRTFPIGYGGNYEVCLKVEKEQEHRSPVYKVILLCEGRYISRLFDLDIRESNQIRAQKGLIEIDLPKSQEIEGFMDLLGKITSLAMIIRYIRNSVSIEEATHSVWMFNHVLSELLLGGLLQSQYDGYEIWLTAVKEEERGPISFNALLLYKGRVVATLFRNIGILGLY